jgi:hypothetical protein
MKALRYLLTAALLSAATSSATASDAASCPLANIESQKELHEFLSMQAVKVVALAVRGDRERLAALVTPFASFGLGAGDVGRPLGTGIQGIEALADTMSADTYRYLGWDYMDGPAEPCSLQKVTVEFVNSREKRLSQVEFTFEGGRLINASGWERSFEGGSVNAAHASQ